LLELLSDQSVPSETTTVQEKGPIRCHQSVGRETDGPATWISIPVRNPG